MTSYRNFRTELDAGKTSCVETLAGAFHKIEEQGELNAYVTILRERAEAKAEEVDRKVKEGTAGSLAGMLVAVKDNIALKDVRLTCGSKILENFTSLYSATALERLEAADAIIVGKTNMDEFAMGSSNENSYFGSALNPLDRERVPGGSSGGSAVAVASGTVHTSLGSETGGSVRQPAAFTGTVGVKPTYGRISRFGLVAFASSLDQIGPIAHTVYDAALLLQTIAGHDPNDATSSMRPVPDYTAGLESADVAGMKIGVPKEYFIEGMEESVVASVEDLKKRFQDGGATLVEISLPHTEYVIPTYYVIATAEASSNLARYDGARYGYRSPNATNLEEMYEMSRSEGFGEEVKRRIMLGTFVLSSGYYDAYYRKAQQVRTLISQDFERAFSEVDLILTPTAPTAAFKLGEKTSDPISMYLSDIFTAAANIAGIPGISVPYGTDPTTNLPLGAQLMAPHFEEGRMFRGGAWIEQIVG
ncbi:MAG: Asp-tRNA(Asn)/Glu-tRNA(Gln) amidotransferase subunit GatA [Ignavibacteriae bacterium]|nr:Asp-tRNA(Asn)/Glu-tRNA(Gln) amidotransferase subunit GatA [Ignavibacteriota bacterium]MCB9216666.1 Asp-tRNA(Asn)/Glu-tRNA(Gln) amidotransferase subunit GatA [Ignavibacteria bacterium]